MGLWGLVGGCRGDGSDDGSGGSGTGVGTLDGPSSTADETSGLTMPVLYLEVSPFEYVAEVDLGSASTVDYTVTAVFVDGTTADVTELATFEISSADVGAMNGATLEIPSRTDSFFASAIVTATVGEDTGQAQVTLAAYDLDSDFFFILPFEDGAGEQTKPLTFSTEVKSMDVFVNMDTTFSMDGALLNLQNAMADSIIPGVQALVPDTQFGGGTFQDFPLLGYGIPGSDQPFVLYQTITEDASAVQDAVLDFMLGDGADPPESHYEALYQIATGEGLAGPAPTSVEPNRDGLGGVGFREGALPVVVSITNQGSHGLAGGPGNCPAYTGSVAAVAHSREQAIEALGGICARVVQIAVADPPDGDSAACNARTDGIALTEGTGSLIPPEAWDIDGRPPGCAGGECCTGSAGAGVAPNGDGLCPMVFEAEANGNGVDTSFSSAIQLLAAYGRFGVTRAIWGVNTDVDGQALPAGTSTADFIKGVTPVGHGPVPLPGVEEPTLTEDTFEDVIPNTDVIFDVRAFNDFVPQTDQPQVFVANIEVLADDCGELDARDVFILVPPVELPPPG
ncbi:MAG: hypothetical protein KDK70_08095 [Myxococcales bacterium]|nr:hypothetical protein [Myxococcales bacterium]